ncbi:hypothetical protein NHX12_033838 [Muraenolepis orangiensis]|uniref:Uncharacterized protein n=1 Tax=Muraenolepis orangiensis TaxID=630683 RepID=A0A9Q0E2I1_9TELE|nr:hypothetical protein NHX12_033838 [Muraenolepis orangiensis]
MNSNDIQETNGEETDLDLDVVVRPPEKSTSTTRSSVCDAQMLSPPHQHVHRGRRGVQIAVCNQQTFSLKCLLGPNVSPVPHWIPGPVLVLVDTRILVPHAALTTPRLPCSRLSLHAH